MLYITIKPQSKTEKCSRLNDISVIITFYHTYTFFHNNPEI